MGAGRSGSTILGVTLGNCDGVFHAGELDKWLLKRGRPQLDGEDRERFWSDVRELVPSAEELFGGEAHRYLERSSALFRGRRLATRRRLRERYRRVNEELYRAIAQTAGVAHVVDTGHYPLRARELQHVAGIDLHLIFLVRDPHSVVASLGRKDVPERSFNELTTNAYLWLTYLVSLFVFLRQPRARRMFLRHEDFVADPAGIVRCILERSGCAADVPDLSALRTGFPLQGNRLIRSDVVALNPRASAPPERSLATTLLQLPWTLVFGALRPRATAIAPRGRPMAAQAG
jgi:hypothetical protein